jgi:hypothetical protein
MNGRHILLQLKVAFRGFLMGMLVYVLLLDIPHGMHWAQYSYLPEDYDMLPLRLFPHDDALRRGVTPVDEFGESVLQSMLQESEVREAGFVFVTAVSAQYYDRLANLVGSIHNYEPNVNISIYDTGLSQRQRGQINFWNNCALIDDFLSDGDAHTDSITDLSTYGFKAAVIRDALQRYESFLFLDAGVEIWKPIR